MAIDTLSLLAGTATEVFSASCAFRIRVSMSAMGSLMLIQSLLLPACLGHAGNLATHGDLAQLAAAQTELAEHPARTPRQRAAIAQPHRAGVARKLLKLLARLRAVLVRNPAVVDDCEQLGAPGREFLHGGAAFLFAIDQCGLCHGEKKRRATVKKFAAR